MTRCGDRTRLAVGIFAALACTMPVTAADAQAPAAPPASSVAERFDGAMRSWMSAHGVPRASVAVMRDSRLVFAAGYGGRAANERVPVWSLSKAITALCVAGLVKDEKLKLDDAIGPLLATAFAKFGEPRDARLKRGAGGNLFAPGPSGDQSCRRPSAPPLRQFGIDQGQEAFCVCHPMRRVRFAIPCERVGGEGTAFGQSLPALFRF
jgi:hypothetical protein